MPAADCAGTRAIACDGHVQQTAQQRAQHTAVVDLQVDSKISACDNIHKDKTGQQQAAIIDMPVTEYVPSTADNLSRSALKSPNQLVNAAKTATEAVYDSKAGDARRCIQDGCAALTSLHAQLSNAASLPKTVRLQESPRKAVSALQHYDSAPAFMQATKTSGPESARRATSPTLLRNQHLPGVVMHQKTAFPANMTMKHDAGISSVAQGRHPRASADALVPSAAAAASGAATTSPAARPKSPTAVHNQQLQQLWKQHSTAEPTRSLRRQQSHSALLHKDAAATDRSAPKHTPVERVKQAAKLRQISSIRTASTASLPKKPTTKVFIEPFYEGTSHPLGRSQTWASQWLAMGSPDDLTDTAQTHSLPAPLLHFTSSTQALPGNIVIAANSAVHEGDGASPDDNPAQADVASLCTVQAVDTPADQAVALVEQDGASMNATSVAELDSSARRNTTAVLDSSAALTSTATVTQWAGGRPASALGSINHVVTQKWQLDLRRLHSARPGSGGSPTARSASASPALLCMRLHVFGAADV